MIQPNTITYKHNHKTVKPHKQIDTEYIIPTEEK
jgi:hypothetical protein